MRIQECFGMDGIEYTRRMKGCSIYDLREREVTKTRQIINSGFSVGRGMAGACHSGGFSLILSAIFCRQRCVAIQKLKIIQREITSRGYAKYEPGMRDWCIPCAIFTCGLCVGTGVHIIAADLVNQMVVPTSAPPGPSVILSVAEHPGAAALGSIHGVENQVALAQHAATLHSSAAPVQLPASVPSSFGGEAGYAASMWLAPTVEDFVANVASTTIANNADDRFETKKYPVPTPYARR